MSYKVYICTRIITLLSNATKVVLPENTDIPTDDSSGHACKPFSPPVATNPSTDQRQAKPTAPRSSSSLPRLLEESR